MFPKCSPTPYESILHPFFLDHLVVKGVTPQQQDKSEAENEVQIGS